MKYAYPVAVNGAGTKPKSYHGEYDRSFSWLKDQGYEGIELLIRDPSAVDVEELDRALEKWDLTVAAIGTGPMQMEDKLFLLHPDQEKTEAAKKHIDGFLKLCSHYQAPALIGKYRGEISDNPGCRWDDFNTVMRSVCEKAAALGVDVLVEPQNRTNINNLNTVDETLLWINHMGCDNLGILADIYHMAITETSMPQSIRNAADKIRFIHMSDSSRLYPGQGELNIAEVMDVLDEIGYSGYISLEVDQVPDSRTVSKESIEYLKKCEKG